MDLHLPDRLHSTRDLLMRSLATHPHERAPAMPAELLADLEARFAPRRITFISEPKTTWLQKVSIFLATPAFGIAAAAIVVVGVAVPMISGPATHSESFRGGDKAAVSTASARVIFMGDNPSLRSAIENSGDFEASAFISGLSLATIDAMEGPKVIVDFNSGTITAVDSKGATVHQSLVPTKAADASTAISTAISHF